MIAVSPTPPMPPYTPMPTPRSWHQVWPTCTPFPELSGLAIAIQDECLLANGDPIILDRDGPIWRQARQMYGACPLGPEVRVVHDGVVYWAQRFRFGYLFYEPPDGEMYYMTHAGWQIHAAVPCVRMDTTPVVPKTGTVAPTVGRCVNSARAIDEMGAK